MWVSQVPWELENTPSRQLWRNGRLRVNLHISILSSRLRAYFHPEKARFSVNKNGLQRKWRCYGEFRETDNQVIFNNWLINNKYNLTCTKYEIFLEHLKSLFWALLLEWARRSSHYLQFLYRCSRNHEKIMIFLESFA